MCPICKAADGDTCVVKDNECDDASWTSVVLGTPVHDARFLKAPAVVDWVPVVAPAVNGDVDTTPVSGVRDLKEGR